MTRRLCLTACVLTGAAGLLASPAAVLAQPANSSGVPLLIQQRGQQQEQLIQGQATTQLNQRQIHTMVNGKASSGLPPTTATAPASAPQLVTQEEVLLQRQQRIERLNKAKVEPATRP